MDLTQPVEGDQIRPMVGTSCEQLRANTEDMVETYLAGDIVAAWIKFLASIGDGELP